jgi:hypothetical protein
MYPMHTIERQFLGGKGKDKNLRRTPRSLQKSTLADLTLDILCLLVDLELGLGDLGVFVFAVSLGGCFCSLFPTWSVRLYGGVWS